jgi:hypothetical protein
MASLALTGCEQIDALMGKEAADSETDPAGAGGGSTSSGGGSTSSGGGSTSSGGAAAPLAGGGTLSPGKVPAPSGGFFSKLTVEGPPPIINSDACDDMTDGGPMAGPDCVTADIKCGDTVVGHTRGGVKKYDTKYYEDHYCWPATVNRDGGDERVYRLVTDDQSPEFAGKGFTVEAWLDSPCADLDLTIMDGPRNSCPTKSAYCDTTNKKGGTRGHVNRQVDAHSTYYIMVEGRNDDEGVFAFTVKCSR